MYLLIAFLLATACANPVHEVNPEEGDYFEGDIVLPAGLNSDDLRAGPNNAIIGAQYRWPSGRVPYEIDYLTFSDTQISQIQAGVAEINQRANCVRLEEVSEGHNEDDYVWVSQGGGCSSFVGRVGGEQRLSLNDGCFRHGTIVHEFLHALGFYHEQSRGDRDQYVEIVWDNIIPGRENNFRGRTEGVDIDHVNTAYDYDSCMHYGGFGFAIDRSIPTIVTLDPAAQDRIGQRVGPTDTDMRRVQNLYCPP